MSTDSGGLEDTVQADLNPDDDTAAAAPAAAAVPRRPSESAGKAAWVDYVVALGADRDHVEGNTRHWDGDGYVQARALTREQLADLAG